MLFAMGRSTRRNAMVALLVVFVLWHYRAVFWATPPSEWARLEHRMNHAPWPRSIRGVKSSFDWSRVELRYLPTSPQRMPTRARGRDLPAVQHRFGAEGFREAKIRVARQNEVRVLFQKNWESYRRLAWKKDALLPISGGSRDQFSGWAATLVDSLDTLWIMGLRDEFDEAVSAVAEIDFGTSSSSNINMFETNIRYLGGLLAAYDLSSRRVLLEKATELGDLIYAGFNTKNGMPVDFLDFDAAKKGDGLPGEYSVVSASPGTLSLELTRLSQLTDNAKYYNAISKVMDLFHRDQNKTQLPGVWPITVSMGEEDVVDGGTFTLGASADSLYEYLPKMHQILGGGGHDKYETMAKTSMATADRYFLFRPMVPGQEDILMPGNVNIEGEKPVLDPETEHLACFLGGMFALAGRLFDQPDSIDTGSRLTSGCVYAYRSFPTGIMPERLNMVPCPSRSHCPWDEDAWIRERKKRRQWQAHLPKGFTTAKDPRYLLRPEAIESVFYMYRITGRAEFQDAAWAMFKAVSNGTRTEFANAAVLDVTRDEYPLPKEDYMESFWLAETLKYFYLVFSPPDIISLDHFVLNTEAHSFRVPA